MAIIIDLESEPELTSPSPTQSKKRSHDGTLLYDGNSSHNRAPENFLKEGIQEDSSAEAHSSEDESDGSPETHTSEDGSDGSSEAHTAEYESDEEGQEINALLLQALDNIEAHSAGSFDTCHILSNAANPGLFVKSLGGIGLPLSENDARRLAAASIEVPLRNESKTVAGTTMGTTWKLCTSQFELRNPAWLHTLNAAVAGLLLQAGIPGVRAELCNLLLYEEGASFERCRAPEKGQGIFGTLVMALPSSHKGGAIEVKFGKDQRLMETAPTSDFDFSCLAWYADVEHSVQKITSGHRLVLTYNLIHDTSRTPCRAADSGEHQLKLNDALHVWQVAYKKNPYYWPLAYQLGHRYTEANLRLSQLKGLDHVKAQCLQRACQEQGFSFFLANIEQTVEGDCDYEEYRGYGYGGRYYDSDATDANDRYHSITNELERSIELETVVRTDGSVFATGVHFEEGNILQENTSEREPDEEDYEGDVGNEYPNTTHYYRDSVILIMPKDSQEGLEFEAAMADGTKIKGFLQTLSRAVEESRCKSSNEVPHTSSEPCHTRLERFCKHVIANHGYVYNQSICDDMVAAALLLDHSSLFLITANAKECKLSLTTYRKIGMAMPFEISEALEWQNAIALVARRVKEIHNIWDVLAEVAEGFKVSLANSSRPANISLDSLYIWMYSTITTSFEASQDLESRDGAIVEQLTQICGAGEQSLFQTILPYVKKNVANKAFTLAFLSTIYVSCEVGDIRKEVVANLYRDILSELAMEFFKLDELGDHSTPAGRAKYIQRAAKTASLVKAEDIAKLLGHCLSLGLKIETQNILRDIVRKSESYPVVAFGDFWFPFLQHFLALVATWPDQESNEYRHVFQDIIGNYVRRYLGEEPPIPTIAPPSPRGCGCAECKQLDRFLLDSEHKTRTFRFNKPVRLHLESRLGSHYSHRTELKGSPYALIVTKNEGQYRARRAVSDYKKRYDCARKTISWIGLTELNKVLGTKGEELIDFKSVRNKLIASGHTRVPLGDISQPIVIPDSDFCGGVKSK